MKRLIGIFIIVNLALFLWQCRKKISDTLTPVFSTDCYAGSFTITKFGQYQPMGAVTLPDNSIAVLTQLNSGAYLYYFDSHGRLISKNRVTLPFGSAAMNIIYTPDNSFIISSASNKTIDTNNVYYPSAGIYTVNYNATYCDPYTRLNYTTLNYYSKANISTSYVSKIDRSGNVKWVRQYRGNTYSGNSLAMSGSNILYLENRSNLTDSIVHGTIDTLKSNYQKHNTLVLHALDLNGAAVWDKEFDNISGIVSYNSLNANASYQPPYQANVKVNGDKILVQSAFDILILDPTGKVLTKNNFINYYCSFSNNNYSTDFDIYFNIAFNQNSYAVYMPMYGGNSRVAIYDYNNNITGYFQSNLPNYSAPAAFYQDHSNNYVIFDGTVLMKFDNQGNVYYNQRVNSNSGAVTSLTPTCDGGNLITSFTETRDSIGNFILVPSLIKADVNGNF